MATAEKFRLTYSTMYDPPAELHTRFEEEVAKELREEADFTCRSSNFLFYQDNPPEKPGDMHCINFYFECIVSGSMMLNEESSDSAWITQAEFDRYDMVIPNGEGLTRYWATKS